MRVRGDWPEVLTITAGWAKATARPWNSDLPYGYLRLERGGARFLREATQHVLSYEVDTVLSPPLPVGTTDPWIGAGFEPLAELNLFGRSLLGPVPGPQHRVAEERTPDFERLADLDRQSFERLWRSSPCSLRESYRATSRRVLLAIRPLQEPEGYAIVGIARMTAYLQRLAVLPSQRRRGWGTRLTLAAVRWAARHGATRMVLNTPVGNHPAAALYRSAGFDPLPRRLHILHSGRLQPGLGG